MSIEWGILIKYLKWSPVAAPIAWIVKYLKFHFKYFCNCYSFQDVWNHLVERDQISIYLNVRTAGRVCFSIKTSKTIRQQMVNQNLIGIHPMYNGLVNVQVIAFLPPEYDTVMDDCFKKFVRSKQPISPVQLEQILILIDSRLQINTEPKLYMKSLDSMIDQIM